MNDSIWQLLIKYVIVPNVAKIVADHVLADPTKGLPDDATILAKLPADIAALLTSNQAFLDRTRPA